jgi:hypothetical protein
MELLNFKEKLLFPGTSLARYWRGIDTQDINDFQRDGLLSQVNFAPNLPEWLPVSKGNMLSLVIDPYHYIKNGDGREELYHFRLDPWEKHDVSASEESQRIREQFRAALNMGLHQSAAFPVRQPGGKEKPLEERK